MLRALPVLSPKCPLEFLRLLLKQTKKKKTVVSVFFAGAVSLGSLGRPFSLRRCSDITLRVECRGPVWERLIWCCCMSCALFRPSLAALPLSLSLSLPFCSAAHRNSPTVHSWIEGCGKLTRCVCNATAIDIDTKYKSLKCGSFFVKDDERCLLITTNKHPGFFG